MTATDTGAGALSLERAPEPAVNELLIATDPHAAALARIPRRYETIDDWEGLGRWIDALQRAELFVFETETIGLDYMRTSIVGVSLCVEPGHAAYVPLAHAYAGAPAQLDRSRVLEALRPMLEDPARAKLGHNLKFHAHALANHGIRLAGRCYDTMLESYVINSTAIRHDLDSMAARYLGLSTIHLDEIAGKGAKQISFDQVNVEQAAGYAAEHADVTQRLHRALWPKLEAAKPSSRGYTAKSSNPSCRCCNVWSATAC